ncbi:hypothetical protein [Paenibacillus typhae]|uniref:Uncharacterized protein n=1 Tax=Paenibacillus typhae TaxID=1174501 RepID=A0A1G8F5P6_9BACL|nr:hypothetical protein [Paenibacillus typhae]SDH77448.1 hypothetical protein SAMN05216192_101140 [Paenibacillus typhae]
MKASARPQAVAWRRRLFPLLCLGLALLPAAAVVPAAGEATAQGSRILVPQAVSQALQPDLSIKPLPSPKTLQEFTADTISRLSAAEPFTAWKNAETEYYPLGPGTHSWLINVLSGGQRIGYLIISAAEDGGYMLSEYGAGTTGLPYSLTELRQFVVQEDLIPSSYSGNAELTALYAPMLPVWKLTVDKQTYYINAVTLQLLPWTSARADAVLKGALPSADTVTSSGSRLSPLQASLSGGQDDPYADIRWLASSRLKAVDSGNVAVLLGKGRALAYQSPGANDTTGAPFMITGYQSWRPSVKEKAADSRTVIYAATGVKGYRYLPFALLQKTGTLHKLPDARGNDLAYGTETDAIVSLH